MQLSNQQIYEYATTLSKFHIEGKVPVKVSFFLQKNVQTLIAAAREISEARMNIAATYGNFDESKQQYHIPEENVSVVNSELNDLFNLKQDLPIHVFKIDDFNNIELTYDQMAAIMFMIE